MCTGVAEVTGSNPVEALIPDIFQASSFQLLKLENLLQWSFFTFKFLSWSSKYSFLLSYLDPVIQLRKFLPKSLFLSFLLFSLQTCALWSFMALHSTPTICNFGQNGSFRHLHRTILHLITHSDSFFFNFSQNCCFSLFSSFWFGIWTLLCAMLLRSAIFCKFRQNRSVHFGHFCWPLELGSCLMNYAYASWLALHPAVFGNFHRNCSFRCLRHFRWWLWTLVCTLQLYSAIFFLFFTFCQNCCHHFSWSLWTLSFSLTVNSTVFFL